MSKSFSQEYTEYQQKFNFSNVFKKFDTKNYYFLYAQELIDINFLYQSIDVIQEVNSKQRKIRSFRYALEILQIGENYEILKTNL